MERERWREKAEVERGRKRWREIDVIAYEFLVWEWWR